MSEMLVCIFCLIVAFFFGFLIGYDCLLMQRIRRNLFRLVRRIR